jgi:hypothetical protein
MKKAYEIALERLKQEAGEVRTLSDEEKQRIAEIDAKINAQIAEIKVMYSSKLQSATSSEEYARIQADMAREIERLEAKRTEEKDRVWRGSGT